jgi:ATP-dependent RNA helicase DeaD
LNHFEQLGLAPVLLQAIEKMGFEKPTPIQEASIPVLLETGRDILGLAQTGTGKTAAFGLPLLQLLQADNKHTQALVVCPTRELCNQISRDLTSFSSFMPGIEIAAVYGGSSMDKQIQSLRRGAQIIVATPGRLMDLMSRRAVKLEQVSMVVLDEADEMLNMGFEEDVEHILSFTPAGKRVCLFSATMPPEIRRIAKKYMTEPLEISVGKQNAGNENIEHEYAVVNSRDKYAALKRVLDYTGDHFYGIIFCTTKIETQDISDKLIKDGYNSDCLHGDLSQQQREKVMNRFRHKAVRIMLATDVAARGIDVSGLTHVVHYHLPDAIENYTHRSGRTARAGKTGISFTLLNVREAYRLKEIEKKANIRFKRIQIPGAREVLDRKLLTFTQTIASQDVDENMFSQEHFENMEVLMAMDKQEIVKKILTLELKRFAADYLNAPDLNAGDRAATGVEQASGSSSRIFVSVGKKDGFETMNFKDWVAEVSGVKKKNLHVYVKGVYSFVDAEAEDVAALLETLNKQEIEGRIVRAEITARTPEQGERKFKGKGRSNNGHDREREGGGWKKQPWSGGGNKSSKPGNFAGKRDFASTGFKKKKY